MQTEFLGVSFTRQEVLELLRACMLQSLLEDEVRVQQGLEPVDPSPLVERFVQLLGVAEDAADDMADRLSDDLWAYSWYVFTNEWAWFRAKQEAVRQLGKKVSGKEENTEFRRLAERLYKRNFEAYTKEIDMQSPPDGKRRTQMTGNKGD
jgi:hypothetical protein